MTVRRLDDPSPPNVNPNPARPARPVDRRLFVDVRPLPAGLAGSSRRPHSVGVIFGRRGICRVTLFEEGPSDARR